MKKILFVILAAILIVGTVAACANKPDQNTGRTEENTIPTKQELKATIQEVNESSLLVEPIEGLEDIDVIYLNMSDDTVLNVSDGAPLEPGTIVYAVIGTEIMESYPPQVHLYEITKTQEGSSVTPATNDGDTQLAPENYITGKVINISGSEYTIEVLQSSVYEGQITVKIVSDVLNKDMPIEKGSIIGVYVDLQSNPLTAQKLVFSEPDQVIQLDSRETISGYLEGAFPQTVYYMSDEHIEAQAGIMFAIGLEENCESGWSMTQQDGVELVANGAASPGEDGTYFNYFGVSIEQPGDYTIEFVNETADGTFDFSFDVTVK